jgi:Aspartyl protease
MGLTYLEGVLTGSTGKTATMRFLVDSGANYSLVPNDVWTNLDLSPKRVVTFTVADGTEITRSVSECHLSPPQG